MNEGLAIYIFGIGVAVGILAMDSVWRKRLADDASWRRDLARDKKIAALEEKLSPAPNGVAAQPEVTA